MNEREQARDNANRWLEQASRINGPDPDGPDPDGPEMILARQYMRALEKIGRQAELIEHLQLGAAIERPRELSN